MSELQAQTEAQRRWGRTAYAMVVGGAFEVGCHQDRFGRIGNGFGDSYESAFANADRRNGRSVIHTPVPVEKARERSTR